MNRKRKGDGYRLGPKFSEYLNMNVKMADAYCLGAAGGAVLLLTGHWLLMMLGMGAVCGCIFSAYVKLFSETLYQKQACLFQSVPVSAFETALVKTLAASLPLLFMTLIYVGGSILFLDSHSESGQALYQQMVEQGFTEQNMAAGTVLNLIGLAIGPFGASGIFLFAEAVGNRLRENRDKKPKRWAILLVVGLLIAGQQGIIWLIQWIPVLSAMAETALSLVFNILLAAGMLLVNTRALERWYSA